MHAISQAAQNGQPPKLAELIDEGHHVNVSNSKGYTALMAATDRGDVGMVNILVEHGVNVNATTDAN